MIKIGTEEFWGPDVVTKHENGVRWEVVKFYRDAEGVWFVDWRNEAGETISQNLATKDYHNAKCQIVNQIHGARSALRGRKHSGN